MRITKISVDNVPPVKKFHVDSLSDLIVIAGANGAGKTRLVSHILLAFQKPALSNIQFSIECTNEEELEQFGKQVIDSTDRGQRSKLQTMLQQNRQRRNFKSGILYFESDRSIAPVQPLAFSFEFADPYTESIGWNVPMQPLKNRWQDTQHAIFKKILTLRNQLGSRAMQLGREGRDQMGLGFDDPIQPFMDAFSMLLAPKRLVQPDLQQQKLMYEENGEKRPIDTLSSGEREVLNVAFDFILRKPTDCIVFFDEPELHLHPELLGRLIRTLQSSGKRNQFFFISHSPEVIASSLDDTVIFLTKPKEDGSNQATILKPDGETTGALLALGQSVGIVALGKKIVLIEGTKSSLDAKVYSAINRDFAAC
ncbi:AAA family ATPase [Parasphingorhabdus sp.]|uniref:AAA family ATPase n=1 Tax=Parasphingorhabdus sp. TaxID=2709688 RepID=UPI003A92F274